MIARLNTDRVGYCSCWYDLIQLFKIHPILLSTVSASVPLFQACLHRCWAGVLVEFSQWLTSLYLAVMLNVLTSLLPPFNFDCGYAGRHHTFPKVEYHEFSFTRSRTPLLLHWVLSCPWVRLEMRLSYLRIRLTYTIAGKASLFTSSLIATIPSNLLAVRVARITKIEITAPDYADVILR